MKLPVPFLQLPLRFDADALAGEVLAIDESQWRPHPNGLPGNSALTLISAEGNAESDRVYGPMRPTPHLHRCPALMQALACLGATWGRTRLMRLSGQAEVNLHVDLNHYWRARMLDLRHLAAASAGCGLGRVRADRRLIRSSACLARRCSAAR